MSDFKTDADVGVKTQREADVASDDVTEYQGASQDQQDMLRMGKTQELKRNFSFLSIFGFSMILMQSWEAVSGVAVIGLINGGQAGLIWMYIVCWVGFVFVNLSMAEMASMAPTTGGQYHWVSEFAPRKHQRFLSYLMGWMCVLGWQTIGASVSYIAALQIQGLIKLNNPDFEPQPWHGTLLTMAVAAWSVLFNVVLARKLPMIESLVLVMHIFAFFGITITLWVLAPRAPAAEAFTTFNDPGWGSAGLSAMVGITAGILPLFGADAAVHMAEELKDASRTLPRTMLATTIVNGAMGWVMCITFAFCLGNLDEVLAHPTAQPFMAIYYNATQSVAGASAMSAFVVTLTCFSSMTTVATSSRQLWAFARDGGMPFSGWFARVHKSSNLPMNALLTTWITATLLSLIHLGSPVALNSITSLSTNALLSSYICSIGCMAWRRATGAPLLPSKFSLGPYALPINIAALVFLSVGFVFAFFPTAPDPVANTMNWNIVMYGGVAIICLAYYPFAKRRYVGPVEYVRKLD